MFEGKSTTALKSAKSPQNAGHYFSLGSAFCKESFAESLHYASSKQAIFSALIMLLPVFWAQS